jgi:hypothetical protein
VIIPDSRSSRQLRRSSAFFWSAVGARVRLR